MTYPEPEFCRPEAYHYFIEQFPQLWTTGGLVRAAIGVSMHAFDDIVPAKVEARLAAMSQRVRLLAGDDSTVQGVGNALHQVLFNEEAFQGDHDKFYRAINSYLPLVLNCKFGLPITLALIYKAVGEGAGMSIAGVNAPGHFMVRVRVDSGWQIVDPFYGGLSYSREQAFDVIDLINRRALPRTDELLAAPTHADWIQRLIGNLRLLFQTEGRRDDLSAMSELSKALKLFDDQNNRSAS